MAKSRISNYGVDLLKYSINNSGIIEFDVGDGEVKINGNLNVVGETTTIGSTDLIVADNTITVNAGETSAGITLGEAGLIFDRGILSNGEFLFQETKGFTNSQTGTFTNGAFVLQNEANALVGLYTNFIGVTNTTDGKLILLGAGPANGTNNAIVSVTGTTTYERNIYSYTGSNISFNGSTPDRLATPVDDDAIPNVRLLIDYVKSYHLYNYQEKISSPAPEGNTEVEVFDTAAGAPTSKAAITIDGSTVVEVFATQTNIEDISITDNIIEPLSTNANLIITGNGTGSVEIPSSLLFTKTSDPTAPADGVKLYSKVEADGGTGLYFVNENSTRDEIISRNKALLYSIIF